jgi:hypothetical protein
MASQSAKTLTISNLQDLDQGKAALAINHAIRQCVEDVQDRPGDESPRKVAINLEFTPKRDADSDVLDLVEFQVKVATKLPVRRTRVYPMLPVPGGAVLFQPGSPMDPRQGVLYAPEAEQADDAAQDKPRADGK